MTLGGSNQLITQGLVGARPLDAALQQFRRARQQAVMEALMSRLTGRSLELLPFEQVAHLLRARGQTERGQQDVPVAAIVGSVGRYNDFTRSFLPLHDWDAQRWAGVRSAGHVADLPPIDLYQIGEAYFVLDGNHRVSIARQTGVEFIQARVVEVHTRVPLSPDVQPDELIIQAEYAAFLEFTRLDDLVPGCDLRVTVPGQYNRLENHIEVHRFFVEMVEEHELADATAVLRWYSEAYQPLVEAIREQGILRDFPHRTETDLYLWLAEHQAQLRNVLGWQIRPDTAVSQLAPQFKPKNRLRQVLDVVVPSGWKGRPKTNWAQERLLDRYSQTLFAEILLPLAGRDGAAMSRMIDQAVAIARRENGRVVALFTDGDSETEARALFDGRCAAAGVQSIWVAERGDLIALTCRRAGLADVVVVDRGLLTDTAVSQMLQLCTRPIWLLQGQPALSEHVLLVQGARGETALFAAAYLAERWHVHLVVSTTQSQLQPTRAYLEMHEVMAEFAMGEQAEKTAVAHHCGLVVVSRNARQLPRLLKSSTLPLLICP